MNKKINLIFYYPREKKLIVLFLLLSASLIAQSQPEKVTFKIFAPKATNVSVVGSFNN